MVYKSHPGEVINRGLFIKFKGLLCGNPRERGESLILNFWPPGSLSVQPRHRDRLPQARGFRTGKKTIHQIFTIDTEIKAKRNNMISELITFRITKAKAKVKFGVKYLCGHACEFDHDKGQKSAISGRRLHWRLSTGFFAFSPVFMCNLVRRAP